jgi:hypothetical protein
MKKQFISAVSLRLLLSSTVLFSGSAMLASSLKEQYYTAVAHCDSLVLEEPAIKYIGSDAEYFYFQVRIENPAMDRMEIVLREKANQTILFADSFTEKYFLKTVAVPREFLLVQWDISNHSVKGKTNQNNWSVNTEVRFNEAVMVTRL